MDEHDPQTKHPAMDTVHTPQYWRIAGRICANN